MPSLTGSKRVDSIRPRSECGPGCSGRRGLGSGDASPVPVENENIIGGERAYVPGPPVGAQELHFQATISEQLDDGTHIPRSDLRIARVVKHGDQIQQLQVSCLGHIDRRSRVGGLPNLAGDQARNLVADPNDPLRPCSSRPSAGPPSTTAWSRSRFRRGPWPARHSSFHVSMLKA